MQAVVAIDPAGGVIEEEARGIMRHRILVVARDVTLRSTLARWLMPAGYVVELAESDGRAREVSPIIEWRSPFWCSIDPAPLHKRSIWVGDTAN